jgi:uncharacterized lipoprotein YmbA
MLLLGLTGCASDPAPTEQLRLTEQALAQAKAVGADEQVAELAMAEAKLLQAQSAMQRDAFKEARVLAEQAELDARLAEARVLTRKSQEQLNELNNRIDRLRQQLGAL